MKKNRFFHYFLLVLLLTSFTIFGMKKSDTKSDNPARFDLDSLLQYKLLRDPKLDVDSALFDTAMFLYTIKSAELQSNDESTMEFLEKHKRELKKPICDTTNFKKQYKPSIEERTEISHSSNSDTLLVQNDEIDRPVYRINKALESLQSNYENINNAQLALKGITEADILSYLEGNKTQSEYDE
jgi:hypothetical protein